MEEKIEPKIIPKVQIDFQEYELKIMLKALEMMNTNETKYHWMRYDNERTEKYKKQVGYIIRKIKRLK